MNGTTSLYPWLAPRKLPTLREIAERVAERRGVTMAALLGPDQSQWIAQPRQEAMWEMRQVLWRGGQHRYSLPQIAGFFARNHTTIMHGVRAHERRRLAEVEEWAA